MKGKWCFFLLAVAVFFSQTAVGQTVSGFGIKGGVGLADQNFAYRDGFANEFKHRTGFDAGFYVQWLKKSSFNILTEFHYLQKGMKSEQILTGQDGPEPLGSFLVENRVDYLSVPILAKVSLRETTLQPYLVVGPGFDFLLSYDSDFFKAVYEKFSAVDVTANIGVGLQSGQLLFEARFSQGIRNAYQTESLQVKNRTFTALVGLTF